MAVATRGEANGPRPRPKPGPARVQRWFQIGKSPFPWEQDALEHVKALMPDGEPFRGWATFSFTALSGRVNECDLFIATPGGLHLIELKGHPGRVVNHGSAWSFRGRDNRTRTITNPLHLTDLKSKELKSQLEWAARRRGIRLRQRMPRVEPAVFLSDPALVSELDEVQRQRVFGRDGLRSSGLPGIWQDLLGQPPQREDRRITAEFARLLPDLMGEIGVRASTAHLQFDDEWRMEPRPIDAGETWEDRLAHRQGLVEEEGRVRVYLVALQANEETRRSTSRAAQREYQVLQGINHPGIAQAINLREHQGGPAILFRHRSEDLSLDDYLAAHGATLDDEARRSMVRQLADALRYAHARGLYHRALAARSVYVSARGDGSHPELRIIDWQSAARDFATTRLRSLGQGPLSVRHIEDAAQPYLAPGYEEEFADPVELDVFGLGAVSYLLLTGSPPADTRRELMGRLNQEGGLHPYAVSDSIATSLDELVFQATRADESDRLSSVDSFLLLLDQAEQEVRASSAAPAGADPLSAVPGQQLTDGLTVVRVLGTGSTARALLVQPPDAEEDGVPPQLHVLKVARDSDKDSRLYAEAAALAKVGGGRIVLRLDGPRMVGGRLVLDLENAGTSSLAERLRELGPLHYEELESFGEDLFHALGDLAAKGVRHRDIKPDNLGIGLGADGREHLMLFDFSLADVPDRDLKAGTKSHLDPFLDYGHRTEYDDHAEWYAAAVTLHEMASGERPVWGDGQGDPKAIEDELPTLAEDLFDDGLRVGLTAFFQRALHRDADRRFDSLRQMSAAWRELFSRSDRTPPVTTPATADSADAATLEEAREQAAAAATLTTSLVAAGLTPRAVAVARSFGAHTVGELLGVKRYELARVRGAGVLVTRELRRRHRQWGKLRDAADAEAVGPGAGGRASEVGLSAEQAVTRDVLVAEGSIAQLAALLEPAKSRGGSRKEEVLRSLLGLPPTLTKLSPWPTQAAVAKALDLAHPSVSRHYRDAVKEWADLGWLRVVRDELVSVLAAAGRVMTARELADELRVRHGAGGDADQVQTAVRALAVVRAAAEAEAVVTPSGGNEIDDLEPRLSVLRRGEQVLIALNSLPGSDAPSAPDLADYAAALGSKADALAAAEPLPGRVAVVRELRAVRLPEGGAPPAETRLVALASAASGNAAASPRLELYPRDLSLERALRLSQAPAGVRRDLGITLGDLLAKVRSRFPELCGLEQLTHVQVEDALKAADFPLEYHTADERFRPPATPGANATAFDSSRTGTATRAAGAAMGAAAAGRDAEELVRGKLAGAVRAGGFMTLSVHVKHLSGAAEAIAGAFPVVPVNVAQVFLTEFRALAAEHGTDWAKVLGADANYTRSGTLPNGLRSYVSRVWPRVSERLWAAASLGDEHRVLFLHSAGTVGRYWAAGGRELLVELQAGARRAGSNPHGLWLLVPGESQYAAPQLEGGHVVEALGESERVVLQHGLLDSLGARGAIIDGA